MSRSRCTRTIGLDVGGTKILGLLVAHGPDGVVIEDRELLPSAAGSPEVLRRCEEVAATLLRRSTEVGRLRPVDADPVRSVGIGLAGFVGADGVVSSAPNSGGLVGRDVRAALEESLGRPVVVDNDANCAAVTAHALAVPSVRHLVAVTFGTGIGGGLIVDGNLVRGARGFAGEPGHMVVDPDGPLCPCGQRGCWERFASGSGLARLARLAVERGDAPALSARAGDPAGLRGEHVVAGVKAGEPDAIAVFDEYAGWVALGVANLINLLDPEVVALGGGVIANGETLLSRVRSHLAERFPAAGEGRRVRVVATPHGPDAGALGAAILAARPGRLAAFEPGSGEGRDGR